uniref:hypothetical protein n=1 Tax=Pedobacter schmidteae TaxID=2201271 RepID=UPI0013CEBDC4|nr:hypothetical protein [Pedobacter schmidteae]
MKNLILTVFLFLVTGLCQAQGKQEKMLAQQIAALEVYKGYLKVGYNIVKGGWNLVKDIKNGDFSLHRNYFNSLKAINPRVKKYARVADVIALQLSIVQSTARYIKAARKSSYIHADEMGYCKKVFDRLVDNCIQVLDELITLTSDNQLELKDDERIKRIDSLYQQTLDDYTICTDFGNEMLYLSNARALEHSDIKSIDLNYGLERKMP